MEVFVYVIAWAGMKFLINVMSCSENGNEIDEAQPSAILPSSLRRVEFFPDTLLKLRTGAG